MKLAFLLAVTASILAITASILSDSSARYLEPIRLDKAAIRGAHPTAAPGFRGAAPGKPPAKRSRPPIQKWSAAWFEKWMPIRSNWKSRTLAS
jgi:hypothetical protein